MATTNIEWTDRVWNPVTGCTKVSAGCKHCYAETIANRRMPHGGFTDRPFTEVRTHEDRLLQPLSWRKPARVFVNSMSDLFHEAVPDEFIDRVFAVMALSQRHTFQVLTKRPERMRAYMAGQAYGRVRRIVDGDDGTNVVREGWWRTLDRFDRRAQQQQWWTNLKADRWPLPNVWLGVSCENQEAADARIPLLLQTPAAVRFVSAEPLLGPLELRDYLTGDATGYETGGPAGFQTGPALDWVIVGGESGPGARPCRVAWVRSIVQQCQAAEVPVFVKQLGAKPEGDPRPAERRNPVTGARVLTVMQVVEIRDRKGGDTSEWPADLRVREFPEVR